MLGLLPLTLDGEVAVGEGLFNGMNRTISATAVSMPDADRHSIVGGACSLWLSTAPNKLLRQAKVLGLLCTVRMVAICIIDSDGTMNCCGCKGTVFFCIILCGFKEND